MALTAPRKTITLPDSGAKLVLRRLSMPDFAEGGNMPDMLVDLAARQMQGQALGVQDLKSLDPKSLAFTQELAVKAIFKHPEEGRIVYKRPEHCDEAAKEFSFYDLTQDDQQCLIGEAFKLVGEGKASAATFPEAQ
jgi:hypothetical protein